MIRRRYCEKCCKPQVTCYCAKLHPVIAAPRFVILMHPKEEKRTIATGRMAHLSLPGSLLFPGTDFTTHAEVNSLIRDPRNTCVLLAKTARSRDIALLSEEERQALGRSLVVFVLDGTWAQARRMFRLSENLQKLPALAFTPSQPSRFIVRQQPEVDCYSTIEAVHEFVTAFCPEASDPRMLAPFHFMVSQQLSFEMKHGSPRFYRATRGQR